MANVNGQWQLKVQHDLPRAYTLPCRVLLWDLAPVLNRGKPGLFWSLPHQSSHLPSSAFHSSPFIPYIYLLTSPRQWLYVFMARFSKTHPIFFESIHEDESGGTICRMMKMIQ
jgi:hypothetical protein